METLKDALLKYPVQKQVDWLEVFQDKLSRSDVDMKDFQGFTVLATKAGVPETFINSKLKRFGYNSWEGYYKDINTNKNIELYQPALIGVLSGIASAIIIKLLRNEKPQMQSEEEMGAIV